MDIRGVTVGIAVSDLAAASNWYRKVFGLGQPDLIPAEGIIEFNLGQFWLQLEEDRNRVGTQSVTVNVEVEDLAGLHQRLDTDGIRITGIEEIPDVMEYFEAVDADQNRVGFIRVLAGR